MTYDEIYNDCCNNKYDNSAKEFKSIIIAFLANEYNLLDEAAEVIFNYAYESGHSAGFYEVLDYADKYGQMYSEIRSANHMREV